MMRAARCPLLARFDGANGGVRWQRRAGGFEGSDQTRASLACDGREEASARLNALSSS